MTVKSIFVNYTSAASNTPQSVFVEQKPVKIDAFTAANDVTATLGSYFIISEV